VIEKRTVKVLFFVEKTTKTKECSIHRTGS
jgi:hypothetical protein